MKSIQKDSGTIHYNIEGIGSPYKRCVERSLLIPMNGTVQIQNTGFKIVYILQGSAHHEIVNGEGCNLEKGDILIVPSPAIQYYYPPSNEKDAWLHVFIILFDREDLTVKRSARLKNNPFRLEADFCNFVYDSFVAIRHVKDAQTPHMQRLISDIRDEVHSKKAGHGFRTKSLCNDLVVCTVRSIQTSRDAISYDRSHSPEHLVEAAKEYIYRHLNQDLALGQIAWHLKKSEEYLARIFKATTGFTVFEFIRELRLNHSKKLLHDSRLSLTEVAKQSGFSSSAHFSRTFRQHVGIPPSQYRSEMTIKSDYSPDSPAQSKHR